MLANLIFGLQVATNIAVFGLAARWFLVPWLEQQTLRAALTPLLLFHGLRTLGAVFLLPSVTGGTLPAAFATQGTIGDLAAVVLALVALVAVRRAWASARVFTWLFVAEGVLDFANAFSQGMRHDIAASAQLGPAWFIPTFAVPAFLVTQVLVGWLLVRRGGELRQMAAA